ncbi:MAG TPA: hypothetical protein VEG66_07215 [Thermoplasmata archaeon]|jgi:uncharacterized OB-fold protein|nr:hypothetical protein [Thermoplasmata archaeon]
MIEVAGLELARCEACHSRFLPSDGPCPKCGSRDCVAYSTSAVGRVLVATELQYPATGWTAPHPLILVELSDGVRVLAIGDGPLPAAGALVEVRHDHEVYRARPEPSR